jgi:DinB superfamily
MSTEASTLNDEQLRYPIGRFRRPSEITRSDLQEWVECIEQLPFRLRAAVNGLDDAQLDTPYRPGGWTVRQLVHHIADSHINSYVRFRLALTEESPLIKPYDEKKWAALPDAQTGPVEFSLMLLEGLHVRWTSLLKSLTEAEWKSSFRHPEMGPVSVETAAGLYAWHSRHHVEHINALRARTGW